MEHGQKLDDREGFGQLECMNDCSDGSTICQAVAVVAIMAARGDKRTYEARQ